MVQTVRPENQARESGLWSHGSVGSRGGARRDLQRVTRKLGGLLAMEEGWVLA